jgi:CubicO group peptidase (beta-lactamase class C family)
MKRPGKSFFRRTRGVSQCPLPARLPAWWFSIFFSFITVGIFSFAGMTARGSDLNLSSELPVNILSKHNFVRNWIVVGPFPNKVTDDPTHEIKDSGFDTDFLESIGGEPSAVLTGDQLISYTDSDGSQKQFNTKPIKAENSGIIDFEKSIGRLDFKVAYAFCYIESDVDQETMFLLGSDDGVKVWINGELIHENNIGRGISLGDDRFSTKLEKGHNRILIKVTQGVRGWGFVLEALNGEGAREFEEKERAKKDFDAFLKSGLVVKQENTWNYMFSPGEFPVLEWENRYLTERVMGMFPLTIRWFDSQFKEVKTAEEPGRYGYYAEGTNSDGVLIRRGGTLYCMPREWIAWAERPEAELEYLLIPGVKKQFWKDNQKAITDFAGRIVLLSILDQKEGAILMSYIDEMDTMGEKDPKIFTPIIQDHDYHLALKRKILKLENKKASLKIPVLRKENPAIVLLNGNNEMGFQVGTAKKLKQVCQEWYDESGEPFVMLIARDGNVILHEAFGERADGKVHLNTVTEIASVTKLLTGLMFAQFVNQGLIKIDDPVGKYLLDFPTDGDKVITLRHCFTHTSGLWGHEEWGGLHNPWLDNVIANLLPRLEVGKVHNYNGMGYDLAGKVMEVVSNKSIFRLMRENFFDPLGLENIILEEDLGFGCNSTAWDLAVIGQLLLNRGSYGDLQFFSEETFEKLLPKPLNKYYPGIDVDWGIGITWMRQSHPEAGKKGNPDDKTILSKNVIGHGSATSTILRVDLDNNLVISQTRRQGGKAYEKYLEKLLLTIDEGLLN